LERRRRRVCEIDHRQGREPSDSERTEELGPQVRDDWNRDRVNRPYTEGDQERGDDGDRSAETGNALQERREYPAESDNDEQFVAAEARDPLPKGVITAGLIRDLVKQQGRPDHVEDENCVPDALGARNGERLPRRIEYEQGHGRGRKHSHRACLRRFPTQRDQKNQEHRHRQKREGPVKEIDGKLGVLHRLVSLAFADEEATVMKD
jgi:hypothetical protein